MSNRSTFQKNLNAWSLTIKRQAIPLTLFLSLSAVVTFSTWVGLALEGFVTQNIVGLFVLLIIFVSLYYLRLRGEKQRNYRHLYGRNKTSVWKPNTGVIPDLPKVNVELKDGSVLWNVTPSGIDWSLTTPNPVKNYMPKRTFEEDA